MIFETVKNEIKTLKSHHPGSTVSSQNPSWTGWRRLFKKLGKMLKTEGLCMAIIVIGTADIFSKIIQCESVRLIYYDYKL